MASGGEDRSAPNLGTGELTSSACLAALTDVRQGLDDCEAQTLERLDELDSLRETLVRYEAQLALREQQVTAAEALGQERSRKIEQARGAAEQSLLQVHEEAQRLTAARAEFITLRQADPRSAVSAPASVASNDHALATPSRKQQREYERDRQQLTTELTAAREQIGRLTESVVELAAARKETALLRKQLLLQQQRLIHARGHYQTNPLNQVRLLEAERDCCARELASAERRVRELHEERQQAERRTSAERLAWSLALEKLRETIANQPASVTPPAGKRSTSQRESAGVGDAQANHLAALLTSIQQMQRELAYDAPASSADDSAELSSLV